MFPMNASPRSSWLSLFGLKNTGRNPEAMSEPVSPVAEVSEHYLSPFLDVVVATTTIPNPAQSGGFTWPVPATLNMRILAVSATITPGGADEALDSGGYIALSSPGGRTIWLTPGGPPTVPAIPTSPERQYSTLLPQPLWLPPGWTFFAVGRLSGASTVPWTLGLSLLVNRIPE